MKLKKKLHFLRHFCVSVCVYIFFLSRNARVCTAIGSENRHRLSSNPLNTLVHGRVREYALVLLCSFPLFTYVYEKRSENARQQTKITLLTQRHPDLYNYRKKNAGNENIISKKIRKTGIRE